MFSNEGPNLNNPEVTNRPRVIPKRYKAINKKTRGKPSLRTETPNKGIAINTAGIKPIKVLKIAVKVKATMISLIRIGAYI